MNYWLELSVRSDYDLNQERKRTPYSVEDMAVTWDMAAYPSLHRTSCVALWVKNNQILDPVKTYLNYDLLVIYFYGPNIYKGLNEEIVTLVGFPIYNMNINCS